MGKSTGESRQIRKRLNTAVLVLVAATALAIGLSPASARAAGETGTISGTVTGGGEVLESVSINACRADGASSVCVAAAYPSAQDMGHFQLDVPPGTYRLVFYSRATGDRWFDDAASEASAALVEVQAGSTTQIATDLTLLPAVRGTVVDSSGTGVRNAHVCLEAISTYALKQCGQSDPAGVFWIPVEPGSYLLKAQAPGYLFTYFSTTGSGKDRSTATGVTVGAGQTLKGRDIHLVAAPPGDLNGDGVARWAVLGDSYISGEGLVKPVNAGDPTVHYLEDTDIARNHCHRSTSSWAYKMAQSFGATGSNLLFVPCSGAVAADVTSRGQYPLSPDTAAGSLSQLFYLDQFQKEGLVDVVLLSVGGNDAKFADVIMDCYIGGCNPLKNPKITNAIDTMQSNLTRAITAIHAVTGPQLSTAYSGAQVMVSNYVNPLDPGGICGDTNTGPLEFNKAEQDNVADYIWEVNNAVGRAAQLGGADLIGLSDVFADAGLCSGKHFVNGMRKGNDLYYTDTNLWGFTQLANNVRGMLLHVAAESFHPTQYGHAALYTTARSQVAANLGYPVAAGQGGDGSPVATGLSTRYLQSSGSGSSLQYTAAASQRIIVTRNSLPVILQDVHLSAGESVDLSGALPSDTPPGWHGIEVRDAVSGDLEAATTIYIEYPPGCEGDSPDVDGDGYIDSCDANPKDGPLADADADDVANSGDNCPWIANHGQADTDGDSVGDVCDADLGNDPFANLPSTVPDQAPVFDLPTPPIGRVGVPYHLSASAAGGLLHTISSGGLPDGLTIDPDTGLVSGTPTAAGESVFTIAATNGAGRTVSTPITIEVNEAVAPPPTPTATPNVTTAPLAPAERTPSPAPNETTAPAPVSPTLVATGKPSFTGKALVGKTLKAKIPTGASAIRWDQAGLQISYQWFVGDQVRSTKTKYKLQPKDAGLPVTFAVVANKSGYTTGYAKATTKTVPRLASKTTITARRQSAGLPGTAKIYVRASKLAPVGPVNVYANGKLVATITLTPASKGKATVQLPAFSRATVRLRAAYTGSIQTKASMSKTLKIKVA